MTSGEILPPAADFKTTYVRLTDETQPAREAQFIEKYGRHFPEHQDVLVDALAVLANGLRGWGYSGDGPESATIHITRGEWKDGLRTTFGDVVGELPPESHALLEGLYKLTGAHTMRDDRAEGETHGIVLRIGRYQGRQVAFQEAYFLEGQEHEPSYRNGQKVLRVSLIKGELARQLLRGLTESQRAEFAAISGYEFPGDTIRKYDVTRNNYKIIARDIDRQRQQAINAGNVGRIAAARNNLEWL